MNLYEDVGREKLNEIINDFNNKSDWTEIVPVVKKHKNCAIKLIKWLESNKGSEKNIGNFINGHKDDIKQIFGTEPSELNKITGYMVSPPWWFKLVRKVVTKHPGAAIDVADFAADVADGAEDVWNDIKNFFSDADIPLKNQMKKDLEDAQLYMSNMEEKYFANNTKASTQQKNSNIPLDLIAKSRDTYSA